MRQLHIVRQLSVPGFFTHIRTLLYKKMGEESTISAKEALMVSSWICPHGVLYWELEVMETFSRLVGCKPESVYFIRGVVYDSGS